MKQLDFIRSTKVAIIYDYEKAKYRAMVVVGGKMYFVQFPNRLRVAGAEYNCDVKRAESRNGKVFYRSVKASIRAANNVAVEV